METEPDVRERIRGAKRFECADCGPSHARFIPKLVKLENYALLSECRSFLRRGTDFSVSVAKLQRTAAVRRATRWRLLKTLECAFCRQGVIAAVSTNMQTGELSLSEL